MLKAWCKNQAFFFLGINTNMESFQDYVNKANRQITNPARTRTQRGFTGFNRLHQNMVPEYKRIDRSKVDQVEVLKGTKGRRVPISPEVAQHAIQFYHVTDFNKDNPKSLGKTGVTLNFDKERGQYILTT
jgi:hypothetical protein